MTRAREASARNLPRRQDRSQVQRRTSIHWTHWFVAAAANLAELQKDWRLGFSFGACLTFGLTLQDRTQKLATEFLAFR